MRFTRAAVGGTPATIRSLASFQALETRGGFRAAESGAAKQFVVLYTSGQDPDWPDDLDTNTGQFVYYGDNKSPGRELHDTRRGGNCLLRNVYASVHASLPARNTIPPFFVFMKHPTPISARSVRFVGLAVPGFPGLTANDDLVAIWRTAKGERFQNYRSVFTVLDVPVVSRKWLQDLWPTPPGVPRHPLRGSAGCRAVCTSR